MAVDTNLLRERYDEQSLKDLALAFKILLQCDLLGFMMQTNKSQVLDGYDDSDEPALLKRIVGVKQTNLVLLSVQELAQQVEKEYSDAQVP